MKKQFKRLKLFEPCLFLGFGLLQTLGTLNLLSYKMDFIDTDYNNAFINMAIDEVLLSSKVPVLRFYQWKPNALSIGRFQNFNDIDKVYCNKNKIDVVRRITGGKTVLHEHELTYSFIIDKNKLPRSIVESYNTISKALIRGLQILGLNPKMCRTKIVNKDNPVCFQEPSINEIVINHKKVVGSAQVRVKGKLLQHGSILTGIDNKKHSNCFVHKPEIDELDKRISYIKYPVKELKEAMRSGFLEYFNTKLSDRDLSSTELITAVKLAKEKYLSTEWTKGLKRYIVL
ncbi:MAG: lipoate--protein ligase family protein [Candidatus Brocadiaceae bacterium]|nr:lipoate--protein ligase family protein [Candidatus Brocadiaceae bacterium]